MHIRRLIESPQELSRFQVVTIPGGFSYGDDIAAGKVFATQLRRSLGDALRGFVDRGGLLFGICNGFQILVKAGLLPEPPAASGAPLCTVTYNDPPGFQDRWVALRATDGPCVFTEPGRVYEMPIAHGEGRVVFRDNAAQERVLAARLGTIVYADANPEWGHGGKPTNPNGSTANLAGMCDPTGRIFGLMPHPDRFTEWTQHPCWTSLPAREHGDGFAMFERGVAYFR